SINTSSSDIFFLLRNKYSCSWRRYFLPARFPCNSAALTARGTDQGDLMECSSEKSLSKLIPVRLAVFSQIFLWFFGLFTWPLSSGGRFLLIIDRILKKCLYSIGKI